MRPLHVLGTVLCAAFFSYSDKTITDSVKENLELKLCLGSLPAPPWALYAQTAPQGAPAQVALQLPLSSA